MYTNTHNPVLTQLFLCNNNVMSAITGAAVIYVTSYNSKNTQKEERIAYEKLAQCLIKTMAEQVRKSPVTILFLVSLVTSPRFPHRKLTLNYWIPYL